MKPITFPSALLLLLSTFPAAAATWIGPAAGSFGDAANWSTATVPATATGEAVLINSGATVDYNGTALTDFKVDAGSVVTITGGSTLKTDQTNWTQIKNGSLILDNGTLLRSTTGNLMGAYLSGTAGSPTTSVITATNNSTINIGGNLILGGNSVTTTNINYTNTTFNLSQSTVILGGEMWLGGNSTTDTNQTVTVNISNSSITSKGSVGFWVFDYNAAGSSMHLNFTGAPGSFIDVANSIGLRSSGGAANNAATWESLWDAGILTAQGQSGLTGALFGNYFVTSGTNIRDTGTAIPYRLTLVPEPSGLLLAAATGSLLAARRRRRQA